jgi:hypothetical protein
MAQIIDFRRLGGKGMVPVLILSGMVLTTTGISVSLGSFAIGVGIIFGVVLLGLGVISVAKKVLG